MVMNDFEGNPLYENLLVAVRSYNVRIPSTRGLKIGPQDITYDDIKARKETLEAMRNEIESAIQAINLVQAQHLRFLEDRTKKLTAALRRK